MLFMMIYSKPTTGRIPYGSSVCACMHACIYIYIHIYIYIYTHTYTYTCFSGYKCDDILEQKHEYVINAMIYWNKSVNTHTYIHTYMFFRL